MQHAKRKSGARPFRCSCCKSYNTCLGILGLQCRPCATSTTRRKQAVVIILPSSKKKVDSLSSQRPRYAKLFSSFFLLSDSFLLQHPSVLGARYSQKQFIVQYFRGCLSIDLNGIIETVVCVSHTWVRISQGFFFPQKKFGRSNNSAPNHCKAPVILRLALLIAKAHFQVFVFCC